MKSLPASLVVLVAAAAASSGPLHGQAPVTAADAYVAAVRRYVDSGDPVKAVVGLQAWAQPEFDAAIDAISVRRDAPLLEAAAVLNVEIAVGVVTLSPASADTFLELGEKLVRRRRALPDGPVSSGEFVERWYAAAASTLLIVNETARAAPWVTRGLAAAPRSPSLQLLAGMLRELNAVSLAPDTWASMARQARVGRDRVSLLLNAKDRYRRIVNDHPTFVAARIRLGRVEWLLDDADAALAHLQQAQREARTPADRYLVAMFLAAILDKNGDVDGARQQYEHALAMEPGSQAAVVALGHLELMAGHPERAQALALAFAARPQSDPGEAWWAYKSGGLDRVALAWLRQRVRP